MNDPERWIDGASGNAEILRLLEASKGAGPTLAEKTALGARLGVSTSGVWLTPSIKALLAGSGIAAGILAYQLVAPTEPAPKPPGSSTSSAGAVSTAAEQKSTPVTKAAEEISPPDVADSDALATATSKGSLNEPQQAIREKRSGQDKRSGTGSHNAPSEARLLSQARHALSTDPKLALQLIETHKRLYPEGVLAQERDVLKVSALQNLGRLDAAAAAEKTFRAEHPESILHVGQSE